MKEQNIKNPWLGLDSYQEGQTLYGRGREIQDLSMAIFHHRQTVVYGRSGIGKSSLIHAGIFPEARRRGCLPISIRLDHFAEMSYRSQLIHAIQDAAIRNGGDWLDVTPDKEESQSLWEFFHRYQLRLNGESVKPLIVIDQFEEIFTLNPNRQKVRAFFNDLADWFNDVMPDYLQEPSITQTEGKNGNSLFTGLQVSSSGDLYGEEMPCHIVFVLREDYLSDLERYSSTIPALKQNRYGLLPITYPQALEIITRPCEGLVSLDVADAIIQHVVTEEEITNDTPVDVAILSLFLSRLFEKKGKAQNISLQLVEEQGEALLEDFYEEIVSPLDSRTVQYLEDVLINADGHRENITTESLYANEWIKPSTIEALEQTHLIRLFSYGNIQRVEFAHDVLCPIIVRRRSQRISNARLRHSQRMEISIFFALILLLFFGLFVSVNKQDERVQLQKQKERLGEMESSLIEKGAQNMMVEHDTYGVIRLLINSFPEEIQSPTSFIADLEMMLRQTLTFLPRQWNDSCVSRVHYGFTLKGTKTAIVSPSRKLVGFNDESGIVIIDSHTGAIVQCFSTRQIDPYNGVFSELNSQNWKYYVEDDQVIRTAQKDNSCRLSLCDIHPADNRCLIIADDTTVLDCYCGLPYVDPFDYREGLTRLCLHDFHTPIINAAYSKDGDRISVLLADSSCMLFDANAGSVMEDNSLLSETFETMQSVGARQYSLLKEENGYGCLWYDLPINDTITIRPVSIREIKILSKPIKISKDASDYVLYKPTEEEIRAMRNYIDSIELPSYLTDFKRSFVWNNDTIWEHGERYLWPIAVNKAGNRIVLEKPRYNNEWTAIYGVYPETGKPFFREWISADIHTLHFSEDDQYLIVNAGEETEEVIYLPPLPELLDSCKKMFFNWQMTDEERYQTYIHMND